MFRIIPLDFRDLFEVVGNRPVADELDVVEAHHARGAEVDGAIAGEHVDDGLADGFPDGATPAFIEGLGNLPVGVGWRARGKPEGVRALDAREVCSKISHIASRFSHGGQHLMYSFRRLNTFCCSIDDFRSAVGTVSTGKDFGMVARNRELVALSLADRDDHHVARNELVAMRRANLDARDRAIAVAHDALRCGLEAKSTAVALRELVLIVITWQ